MPNIDNQNPESNTISTPSPDIAPTTPPVNNSSPQQPSKQNRKVSLILLTVLILIIIGGGIYVILQANNNSSSNSSTLNSSESTTNTNELTTYISTNKSSLIVVNSSQKTIAKLTLPSNKKTFNVLANNGKSVLIQASYIGGPDLNSIYYLVNSAGKVTTLPSTVTAVLNNGYYYGNTSSSTFRIQEAAYLGNDNNYLYLFCDIATCKLDSLNLTTASVDTLYSMANTPQIAYSLGLNGVSPQNIAYLIQTLNNGNTNRLVELNLNTDKITQTLSMPTETLGGEGPISPNYTKLAYNYTGNYQTVIVNLNNGSTLYVKSPYSLPLYWSPDSNKIAILSNMGRENYPLELGYINATTGTVYNLKNFGNEETNQVQIDGWLSNSVIYYTYNKTNVLGNPTGPQENFSINVNTGKVTIYPSPASYNLTLPNPYAG